MFKAFCLVFIYIVDAIILIFGHVNLFEFSDFYNFIVILKQ